MRRKTTQPKSDTERAPARTERPLSRTDPPARAVRTTPSVARPAGLRDRASRTTAPRADPARDAEERLRKMEDDRAGDADLIGRLMGKVARLEAKVASRERLLDDTRRALSQVSLRADDLASALVHAQRVPVPPPPAPVNDAVEPPADAPAVDRLASELAWTLDASEALVAELRAVSVEASRAPEEAREILLALAESGPDAESGPFDPRARAGEVAQMEQSLDSLASALSEVDGALAHASDLHAVASEAVYELRNDPDHSADSFGHAQAATGKVSLLLRRLHDSLGRVVEPPPR